jgi:hypothetical protein
MYFEVLYASGNAFGGVRYWGTQIHMLKAPPHPMNGENQPLVIDEMVKFEKYPVEVQEFMKN